MEHPLEDMPTRFSCDSKNVDDSLSHLAANKSDHHDDLPYNWSQTRSSSDDSEDIESDEEDGGELGEDHVQHSEAFAEVNPNNSYPSRTNGVGHTNVLVSKVEKTLVDSEEESDYEEPKKAEEETPIAATASDVPVDVLDACLKCSELINSDEKVEVMCPRFHANCFRCAQCNCLITDCDFQLIGDAPFCKAHSACLLSDNPVDGEQTLPMTIHDNFENSVDASSQSVEEDNRNGQDSHRGSPPRSDDVLPPTGSAKRLVEQWSSIETLKTVQNIGNAVLLDSPQYAPNTAKNIAARFSDGITDGLQSPKPAVLSEPTEQWPTQGQARGLIDKFSAMQA